jgi:hypothetical protein
MAELNSKNIDAVAGKMLALLSAIAGGLNKLYSCLRDQEKSLMQWKLADFVETTRRQRALVQENLDREKQRIELVTDLVGESRAKEVSLRELAEMFGGKWPDKFKAVSERIRRESSRVAEMKKQNEALIVRSRDLVDGQVKLMLNLASLNRNNYGKSGRKARQANIHKVLDRQA